MLVDEDQNPRISDFGLACTIGKLQPGLSYLERLSSTSNAGAVRWAAPERLSGCKPNVSGDIYSFGCVMFEVMGRPTRCIGDRRLKFLARCCREIFRGRRRTITRLWL